MFIFLNNPLTPFRREDILGKLRFLITETTAFSRNSFLVSLIGATLTPNPSPSRERGIRSYLLLKPAKIIARTKQIPINPPSTQPKTLLNAPIICAAAPVTSNMIAITIAIIKGMLNLNLRNFFGDSRTIYRCKSCRRKNCNIFGKIWCSKI